MPAPWLIPAAISIGSRLIGGLASRGDRKERRAAQGQMGALGDELGQMNVYDNFNRAYEGAMALRDPIDQETMSDAWAKNIGVFGKTGFGIDRQARLFRDIMRDRAATGASMAMEAQGQDLQRQALRGDVLAGQYDQAAQQESATRSRWGGLGRTISDLYLANKFGLFS